MHQWRDLIFRSDSSPDALTDHRNICLVELSCERRCETLALLMFSDYEWREGLPAPKRLDLYLGYGLELNAMLSELVTAPGLRETDRATLLQTREHWLHIDHSTRHRISRYKYFADLMQGRGEVQEYFRTTGRGTRQHTYEQIHSTLMKLERKCYDATKLAGLFPSFNIYDASLMGAQPKKSAEPQGEARATA